jgi:hypothetical protein
MKKFYQILVALGMCFSGAASAQSAFDGIYSLTVNGSSIGFATVQTNGSTMIAVLLPTDSGGQPSNWQALIGQITASFSTATVNARLSTVVSGVNSTYSVSLNGTNLTATQQSCTPKTSSCSFANGTVVFGTKIF